VRADRLISILMLLQTRGHMTAHDLAQHLEVSERTIYRDLDALSMAGIPLYTERGPGGGCSLLDGYQTRLTGLTEMEIRALFLATLAGPPVELDMARAFDDALLKVSAALPESSRSNMDSTRQRFHVDASWWHHNTQATPCLQTIQEAVWQDHKLCIRYCEDDDSQQSYLIEPYGLVTKAATWYLIGMLADTQHVFRVARIVHVEATTLEFTRPTDFNLAACWEAYRTQVEANRPLYAVSLRLAPDEVPMLPYMLSEWGYMPVERKETASEHTVSRSPRQRNRQKKQFIYPRTQFQQKKSLPPLQKKWFGLSKKAFCVAV